MGSSKKIQTWPPFPDRDLSKYAGTPRTLAGLDERQRIFLPSSFVKVSGQEPAGFINQERIDADCLFAGEMLSNDLVCNRVQSTRFAVDPFVILWAARKYSQPVPLTRRPIGPRPILGAPAFSVDIFAPTE